MMLSMIFVPLVVGELKAVSNTPCPKNIHHYKGSYPDIKVFDCYPKDFKQECKVRCWPAGHASAGIIILILNNIVKQS